MKPLLLLHGAIGSCSQLQDISKALQDDFEICCLNFSGHGGKPLPQVDFSIGLFAGDVLKYLDEKKIERINVFGYSMGGYVAVYLAKYFPFRINRIFTLATKFDWNEKDSLKEAAMLLPGSISEKIPSFAAELAQRHHPADWKEILNKTSAMMIAMGKNNVLTDSDFKSIEHQVLLSVGDKDKMVSKQETAHVHHLMKNSKLLILQDTPHPVEKVNSKQLAQVVKEFF